MFQCAECRQDFDTEQAKQVHWKFTHDPNRYDGLSRTSLNDEEDDLAAAMRLPMEGVASASATAASPSADDEEDDLAAVASASATAASPSADDEEVRSGCGGAASTLKTFCGHARPCVHCGKRLGIQGFGLRKRNHERRCLARIKKARALAAEDSSFAAGQAAAQPEVATAASPSADDEE